MKLLLIGGTRFLGRHLVAAAQARHHEVTIFHRGNHPLVGASAEEILGDRTTDLAKLRQRRWDAVLDTCGYLPLTVGAAAAALRRAAEQYVFISSVAAYAPHSPPAYAEATPLATLTVAQAAEVAALAPRADLTAAELGSAYGALKAQCEQAVQRVFGSQALIARPGVLAGPLDPTDRFTYWVNRVARGGEIVAPGSPSRFVQFIDARDVANWLIDLVERQASGIYNVASPPFSLTFGNLLAAMKAATGSAASFTWVSEAFLQREAVQPWSELPLYLPESDPETRNFLSADTTKAQRENLILRPLAETVRDTLAWRATQPGAWQAGLTLRREEHLLRQWHAQPPLSLP